MTLQVLLLFTNIRLAALSRMKDHFRPHQDASELTNMSTAGLDAHYVSQRSKSMKDYLFRTELLGSGSTCAGWIISRLVQVALVRKASPKRLI